MIQSKIKVKENDENGVGALNRRSTVEVDHWAFLTQWTRGEDEKCVHFAKLLPTQWTSQGVRERKRKRNGLDYDAEIPFEKKPQPGFYDVVEEDRPVEQLKFPTTSVELEGEQPIIHANKVNDHEAVRKRSKQMLPLPQISDQELVTIRDELRIEEETHLHDCAKLELLRQAEQKRNSSVGLSSLAELKPKWIACERAVEEAMQQALLRKHSKVLQGELPRPLAASIELIRQLLMRANEGKSSFIPPTDFELVDEITYSGGDGSSSRGGGNLAGCSSSSQKSSQKSWAQLALELNGSNINSSKPHPTSTDMRGRRIQLPQNLQPAEYRIALTFAKTFDLVYGINPLCSGISQDGYYLHWLLVEPEPDDPVQAPYNSQIPPPGSALDAAMRSSWVSLSQPNFDLWKFGRWGNQNNGHGIRQPNFDQEMYFNNACLIYEFLDLQQTMDNISSYLRCQVVGHNNDFWREVRAESLSQQLTCRFGCTPQIRCLCIQGRLCLHEVVFKLSSSLEFMSFTGDTWRGLGLCDSDYILF